MQHVMAIKQACPRPMGARANRTAHTVGRGSCSYGRPASVALVRFCTGARRPSPSAMSTVNGSGSVGHPGSDERTGPHLHCRR